METWLKERWRKGEGSTALLWQQSEGSRLIRWQRESVEIKQRKGRAPLTWIARRPLGQSVGQIDQLAAMVTVLQGTHVHAVPPAELPEPRRLLLRLTVRVQDDAHPQGACTHTHTRPEITHSAPRCKLLKERRPNTTTYRRKPEWKAKIVTYKSKRNCYCCVDVRVMLLPKLI